jgi:hypothetical protein
MNKRYQRPSCYVNDYENRTEVSCFTIRKNSSFGSDNEKEMEVGLDSNETNN